MSSAESPESGLADLTGAGGDEAADLSTGASEGTRRPDHDAEIERLQLRLDELRSRIRSALPEGYDLNELVAASGDRHESEEVFEITSEINALESLAGPLTVPGRTPLPAFDDVPAPAPLRPETTALESAVESARWRWVALIAVAIVSIIAALALLLPYL